MGICDSTNNKERKRKVNLEISNDPNYILPLKYSKREDVDKIYSLSNEFIGRGASGFVYEGVDKYGKKYAIKRINKDAITEKDAEILEARINAIVKHEHIVKCYGVYEDLKTISFVLDLVEGGDLYNFIINSPGGHLCDWVSINLIIQILETLDYLHNEVKIAHRDIKPENFLVSIEDSFPTVKLIDFGLSCFVLNDEYMCKYIGSPLYMALEIAERAKYSKNVDLWSAGVILFNMCTGHQPFSDKDPSAIEDEILNDPIDFWAIENKDLRELCEGLMERHPDFRLSAKQALDKAKKIRKEMCLDHISKLKDVIQDKDMSLVIKMGKYYDAEGKESLQASSLGRFLGLLQENKLIQM